MTDLVPHQNPLHPKFDDAVKFGALSAREIELLQQLTLEQQEKLTMLIDDKTGAFKDLSFGDVSPDGKIMLPADPKVAIILDELAMYVAAEFERSKGIV